MFLLKLYSIKALKKLNLLDRFNFTLNISLNTKKVKIPFINGIGLTNLVLKEEWLDNLIHVLISDTQGVFVDVGANIGQSLIRLKTIKPNMNYMGFEPNSTCTAYVQHLITMNNFQNCFLLNCALSTKTQTLILEKSYAEDSRASIVSSLRPDYFTYKETVLALDFDTYFPDTKITFIKIDVEGAELDVIKGMKASILKHQPLITCEVLDSHHHTVLNFTQNRANDLTELIYSLNYSILHLQTYKTNQKIVEYKKIDRITIKQWTTDSNNDYLFYPNTKEVQILKNLNLLSI